MPPKNEVPFTPVEDFVKFFGLDYEPPIGAMDNLRHAYGIFPFIRERIGDIMSLGDVKR